MRTRVNKYFERKNMIGWSEAGQLQMDQSPAVYCLKVGFYLQCSFGMITSSTLSTVYFVFLLLLINSLRLKLT